MILTIDRVRLSSSDSKSHSDSVRCFSISTGQLGARDLYIKFVKGSNNWVPVTKMLSEAAVVEVSRRNYRKSIISKNKDSNIDVKDVEANLETSQKVELERSAKRKTRFNMSESNIRIIETDNDQKEEIPTQPLLQESVPIGQA